MSGHNLKRLNDKADQAVRTFVHSEKAYVDEKGAEADVLLAAIAMLSDQVVDNRSVLHALGSRQTVMFNRYGDPQVRSTDERVIILDGVWTAVKTPSAVPALGESGGFSGKALWLTESANLLAVEYRGVFSVPNQVEEWAVRCSGITAAECVRRFRLASCIGSLERHLNKYLDGNSGRRTKSATERAAKLRTMLVVVKS